MATHHVARNLMVRPQQEMEGSSSSSTRDRRKGDDHDTFARQTAAQKGWRMHTAALPRLVTSFNRAAPGAGHGHGHHNNMHGPGLARRHSSAVESSSAGVAEQHRRGSSAQQVQAHSGARSAQQRGADSPSGAGARRPWRGHRASCSAPSVASSQYSAWGGGGFEAMLLDAESSPLLEKMIQDSIRQGLLSSVSEVLGMRALDISRADSFVDLGGNEQRAVELSKACLAAGLLVRPADAMGSRTLAELETLVLPLDLPPRSVDDMSMDLGAMGEPLPTLAVSPLQLNSATLGVGGLSLQSVSAIGSSSNSSVAGGGGGGGGGGGRFGAGAGGAKASSIANSVSAGGDGGGGPGGGAAAGGAAAAGGTTGARFGAGTAAPVRAAAAPAGPGLQAPPGVPGGGAGSRVPAPAGGQAGAGAAIPPVQLVPAPGTYREGTARHGHPQPLQHDEGEAQDSDEDGLGGVVVGLHLDSHPQHHHRHHNHAPPPGQATLADSRHSPQRPLHHRHHQQQHQQQHHQHHQQSHPNSLPSPSQRLPDVYSPINSYYFEGSDTISPLLEAPQLPPKSPARASRQSMVVPLSVQSPRSPAYQAQPMRPSRIYENVEQILSLNSHVFKAAVLRPKAGLFENQTVAFLTLASCMVQGPPDCEVKLQNADCVRQLPSIRKSLENKVPPEDTPTVWIVLEQMPQTDLGETDKRKLQTWIQNANEEQYNQIMTSHPDGSPVEPTSDMEIRLHRLVSNVLMVDPSTVSMDQPFNRLGGDAVTALQLAVRCRSQGISISVDDIVEADSLAQLAGLATASDVFTLTSYQAGDMFELSPMQRLYFHTAMSGRQEQIGLRIAGLRFNQSMLLRLKRNTPVEDVRAAVETIVGHHPMLRCRFHLSGETWSQSIETDVASSYRFEEHAVGTDAEVERIVTAAQAAIDIVQGPVFAAHHFSTSDGYQLLFLVAHHLVVDLKSWRVISNDLAALLTDGNLTSTRSVSFQDWVSLQKQSVQSLDRPESLPFHIPPADWDYWGIPYESNTYGRTAIDGFSLSSDVISMLGHSNQTLRTDCSDIFMAALLLSFSRTFPDRRTPTIWNQEHDRAAIDSKRDLSQTVGWFTSLCPLALDVAHEEDIVSCLSRVKDMRRSIPDRGIPYFAANLVEASKATAFAGSNLPVEVMFTYAGDSRDLESNDDLLEQIRVPGQTMSSDTSDIGRDVGRVAIFEVSAMITQDEVKFKFLYHKDCQRLEQVTKWIRNCETLLRDSINELRAHSPELSLSDIPMMEMTYEGLEQLNRKVLPGLNIRASNIEAVFPVAPDQQSILIDESLTPGSSNAQSVYELDTAGGAVDIGRICAAWQQVSDRQPALRTGFIQSVSKNGLYDQVILRRHSPSMLFLECDAPEYLAVTVEDVPALPLAEGSPWHRLIVCQSPGKTLIKLEASRAVCDDTSLCILISELEKAYLHGHTAAISRIIYPEYLACLRASSSSVDYWKGLMSGFHPCQFPSLISSPPETHRWDNSLVNLPISREYLDGFAATHRTDFATIFRVAWALLLRIYVGTEDVCFGYRISGRDIPVRGIEDAVGCFSTILICRLALRPGHSMTQLMSEVSAQHREALSHQHVAINSIEHALDVKGGHLFNTCLSLGFETMGRRNQADREFRHVRTKQVSEFDVHMNIDFEDGQLLLDIGHRLFTPKQAANIAHAFGQAIQTVVDVPGSLVKEADLFSEQDHREILAWNSNPQLDVPEYHVHQLIARRAQDNPDIQAVCAWDGNFNYAQLNEHALALAGHLMTSGLRPQAPVPVVIDKSRWAIVAMLAVLHAGAIVVPVDAEAKSMFSWITKTVRASFVLASDNVRRFFDPLKHEVIIVNEYTVPAMSAAAAMKYPAKTRSTDMACILFKHGSHKTHKGIYYSHGALATACIGQGPTLLINPSSRVMQLSSYSVDIALSEVFTTLVNGGTVCVPSANERLTDFTGAARRMNVNWTYFSPALSRKLSPENLPDLAVVCFRTRGLDGDTYAPWAGKAKVLLVYGSAEACPLGLTAAEVTDSWSTQCIGNPFCGNFWIVSPEDSNRLMPVGAVGELVIGAPTLAAGFDLSHESFEDWAKRASFDESSAGEETETRLLKTGHHVRYREEGEIEFVSSDRKFSELDGHIVRLSEVEAKLRRCLGRGVDVVVEKIAFKDAKSAPVLAAFVELGDSLFHGKEDLSQLTRVTKERLYLARKMADLTLRESLPAYMIPAAYIPVKSMPLTPSLKVCRRDLQKMITGLSRKQIINLAEVSNPEEVQAAGLKPLPFTSVEQQMRSVWSRTMNLDESTITASDGFLSLGGDAVLAHKLVVACREQNLNISVVDLLRNTPLGELCRGLNPLSPSSQSGSPKETAKSPSKAFVSGPKEPQIVGWDRKKMDDIAEASSLQSMSIEAGLLQTRGNINYFMVNANGSLDWAKLENACLRLTEAHPVLRTAFKSYNRQLFQTVFKLRAYRPECQRYQCPGWRLNNVAMKFIKKDQSTVIDLSLPVTQFTFIDAGKTSILIIRLSRAQYDEVSLRTLIRDLGKLYENGIRPLKRPGFCDVMRAAQEACSDETVEYWRTLLEGSSMTQLVSQVAPVSSSSDSRTLHDKIPTSPLQNLGIPFETILKSAWSIVLSNLSGSEDVVFGQLIEGKHLTLPHGQSISDVVGPTGNIIPVRTRLPNIAVTPYEYFRSVQSQHVASIPHESMQLFDIMHKCTSWPSWSRFSTVIQHHNQGDRDMLSNFTIGKASCKLDCVDSNLQNSDIFVRSVMSGSPNVDISLTFCEKRINLAFAEQILKMLSSTISLLTSAFVNEPLMLKGLNDTSVTPRIPLAAPRREPRSIGTLRPCHPNHAGAINGLINSAWDIVMDAQTLRIPDVHSVPYYDAWGSLIPAAEMARYYSSHLPDLKIPGLEHATFSMEEIIDNPSMMQQHEMIIAKMQAPAVKRKDSHSNSAQKSGTVWGNHIRRLTVGGTSSPTPSPGLGHSHNIMGSSVNGGTGQSAPTTKNLSSEGSVESLTTGSSHSDHEDDELLDDLGMMGALSPRRKNQKGRSSVNKPSQILGVMV